LTTWTRREARPASLNLRLVIQWLRLWLEKDSVPSATPGKRSPIGVLRLTPRNLSPPRLSATCTCSLSLLLRISSRMMLRAALKISEELRLVSGCSLVIKDLLLKRLVSLAASCPRRMVLKMLSLTPCPRPWATCLLKET